MNENNMIDSVETVNNYCSNEYSVRDIATTCVPNIVKVFDGLAQGVFFNAAHNCKGEVSFGNLNDPVSVFKLSRGIRGPTNILIHQVNRWLQMASIRSIKVCKMPKDGVLLQLGLTFGLWVDVITVRFQSLQ